jgi:hypothetical protein
MPVVFPNWATPRQIHRHPALKRPASTGVKTSTTGSDDIGRFVKGAAKDVEGVAKSTAHSVESAYHWSSNPGSWEGMVRGIPGILHNTSSIVNGVGAYLGVPNWITGYKGQQLTYKDTLEGLGMYNPNGNRDFIQNIINSSGNTLTNDVQSAIKGIFEGGPAHPNGPGHWINDHGGLFGGMTLGPASELINRKVWVPEHSQADWTLGNSHSNFSADFWK